MTNDRWARIDTILQAALVRPPDARELFVKDACGNDATLCDEVLSLLAHAASADGFLEPTPSEPSKRLERGEKLGSYTINEWIGAGGMGEVYRARDPRLDRDVAIKILPRAVSADPDRLRRFEQEARAAAALNHPNIVTVHSVEQAEGVHFLTMELVEGTPLSDRIPRDGLPLDRLLEIAVPLADAVGAAHARGIVHRDLKPANVMVTPEGRVKILDFGLAKLKPLIGVENLTTSPVPAATAEGRLLGTVAYMSPEQAEGREVDHRSDIFSLGVLLYELATGKRPFTGESSLSLLSSILKDTPRSVTDLKPDLPGELARIVRRCLAKDPGRRYQSAIDVRNELEELRQELAAGAAAVHAIQDLGWLPGKPRQPRRLRAFAWIAAGTALLTAALAYFIWRNGGIGVGAPSTMRPLARFAGQVEIPVPMPESVKVVTGLSLSPDGTRLAFTGGGQLWIYDLATREVRPVKDVVGPAPRSPFWSPDGQFIAYFQGGSPGKLRKIPAAGGIAETICDVTSSRGGSWGANDTIIFAEGGDTVYRVAAGGGTPVRITALAKLGTEKIETGHLWPQFLADGQHFTYMTFESRDPDNRVYMASLENESRHLVGRIESRAFVISRFLVTAELGILRARKLSTQGTELAGEPTPLAQNVPSGPSTGDYLFAATPAVLAYLTREPRRSQFSIVDRRDGKPMTIGPAVLVAMTESGIRIPWSLSPTGQMVAYTRSELDAVRSQHVELLDLTRGTVERFTSGRLPVWNRSGNQIAFTRSHVEGRDLYLKSRGSDRESRVGESSNNLKVSHDWHQDGTLLFGMQTPPGRPNSFWLVETEGSPNQRQWFPADGEHVGAQFSPDGKLVAYQLSDPAGNEIYVRRFPSADGKVKIPATGGRWPRWRPDGKALFYIQDDVLMEVDLDVGATVKAGVPRKVLATGENRGYAVLPDGRFVLCRPIDPVSPPTITIRLNWAEGLTKK